MLNKSKVKYVKIKRYNYDILNKKDSNTIYFISENNGNITLNLGDKPVKIHNIGDFLDDNLEAFINNLTFTKDEIWSILDQLEINGGYL